MIESKTVKKIIPKINFEDLSDDEVVDSKKAKTSVNTNTELKKKKTVFFK